MTNENGAANGWQVPPEFIDQDVEVVGRGFYWDELPVGRRFRTLGRTVTEADIINFVSVTGMVEEMFTNVEYIKSESKIGVRPVPGSLVFCISEGLLMQSTMQRTGMAFLNAEITIQKPTSAGDTLHVDCEVVESRPTSKPGRGLVRTYNRVVNQRNEVVATYSPLRMVKGSDAS